MIADALSHNQINHFFSLAPQAKRIPLPFQTDSSSFKPATSTPTTTGPILYMSSSTYRSGWKQFKNFCHSIQVRPVQASKSTITLFTAYLSRRVSPSMARVYLAAVSLLHCQASLNSPSCHNPRLQLVPRKMARCQSQHTTRTRKPITTDILQRLLTYSRDCSHTLTLPPLVPSQCSHV